VDRRPARERLLAAADELFYAEGVHSVGIDRVIERAGVAKASLYSTFGSKDGLIRAYLDRRREVRRDRIEHALAGVEGPREKILAIFDVLGDVFAGPSFRGCAFVRASAEHSGAAVTEPCDSVRSWEHSLFRVLCTDAGAREPERVAEQLMLLYDGATVSAALDHRPRVAEGARKAAEVLLDAATA
jgi:AcrR family transcriptional regulator